MSRILRKVLRVAVLSAVAIAVLMLGATYLNFGIELTTRHGSFFYGAFWFMAWVAAPIIVATIAIKAGCE